MFNGIIHRTGKILKVVKEKNYSEIILKTDLKFKKSDIGSSLSCNGTCLTITRIKKNDISFYLSKETLKRTNFGSIKIGDLINIEESLAYGNKISGHYVQGHVDTTGLVSNISILDKTWIITFKISEIYKKFLIEKGSISINGVSLTISKVKKNTFKVCIIPHTLKLTNLIKLNKKNLVNIEFDIFGKYLLNIKK
ncbi:riboflavin synthase [Pelagibacteraceae bacterium]|mgnify:FL=1|nr:riboflavin synthase [Pelagibacteraceae bacterium]|tara:strand:- start:293 stop:877 length:585 start_codon:yes stop_codon:yes gene_type:complete